MIYGFSNVDPLQGRCPISGLRIECPYKGADVRILSSVLPNEPSLPFRGSLHHHQEGQLRRHQDGDPNCTSVLDGFTALNLGFLSCVVNL